MKASKELTAHVDEEGRLVLPPGLAFQYGLEPGTTVYVDQGRSGLGFHPSVLHLKKVYIEPTNRCNLECRTCIRHSWEEPLGHMSDETFDGIVEGLRTFDSIPSVFFGGFGEPLAHPRIVEMVSHVKNLGARAELISNGTLLDEEMAVRLVRAGLDTLWISLDGATPESYADVRLGAALPEVVANIRRLVRLRGLVDLGCSCLDKGLQRVPMKPDIGIVFVAMKHNLADLPEVVSLGTCLGATRFMVTNVLPYTRDMCEEALYSRSLADQASIPDSFYALDLPKIDLDRNTANALFGKMIGGKTLSFAGVNFGEAVNRCPFVDRGSAAIAWDGSMVPCLPLLHDHTSFLNQIERTSKRYAIGNVREQSLKKLWTEPEYVLFRDRVQRFDFSPCTYCSGCDLSEGNEEDCVGNGFPTCGGCLWAQGVVQCP